MTIPADPSCVSAARRETIDYGRALGADEDSLSIAVGEALANAVLHAYRDGKSGSVDVEARKEGSDLIVTVADEGVGLKPNPETAGLGIGMSLIGAATEEVTFQHLDPGLSVQMRFPCPGS